MGIHGAKACSNGLRTPRVLVCVAVLILCLWLATDQPAIAATGQATSSATSAANQETPRILVPLYLDTVLDSKKRSVGDKVTARIAAQVELSDGTVLPRDAEVVGHLTESKARSKGDSESSLTIVFEKVSMPGGKAMNIKGHLRAVAPNPNEDEGGGGVDYGSSLNRSLEHAGPGSTSHSVVPILNAQSEGVLGIKGLSLANDGVLRSDGKSVKLARGVQIMLRVGSISAQ
jgi:hypothetical protein